VIGIALVLALQAGLPSVSASVDRSRLAVGEELVLSVRATSAADEPVTVTLPSLDGFEIMARTERTEVAIGNTASRTTALEVRLRATRAGTFRIGAVTAQQGASVVRTAAITITVGPGTPGTGTVSPRLRALLERAPPPSRPGEPALVLVASSDRIYVGEQVDIVTAAWFPRDLRARLRRPPTLSPPGLAGVWSYPQPTPPGIAASRQVGDTWYDLFVSHQIVFPLAAGTIDVSRASLQYSVPVAMQFFSQEERYTLESNPVRLTVVPLPAVGRPAGFSGAVGRGLALSRTVGPSVRAGEAIPVEVTLEGEGNVALWPAPELAWPEGLRHYQDRTDDRIAAVGGRLGGTKLFQYLAMPDSAGPLRLPAIAYSYFDLATESYRTLTAPARMIMVAPASEAATSRPTPPPLIAARRPPLARRITGALPAPVWIAVALLPALLWFGLGIRDRRQGRHQRRRIDREPALGASDRRLLAALRSVVPDADLLTSAQLVSALRAAGVEPALAQRIARVRQELLSTRYGPGPHGGRPEAEIMREMDELTRALGGQVRHRERRVQRSAAVALLLALGLPAGAGAQASAEQLYADGAYRQAAESFAARAAAEPDVAAHWYGLGAAQYRLGSDARAGAAWLRAARLAPRSPSVRRALRLVPAPDAGSRDRLRAFPVTPDELMLAALLLWLAGWSVMFASRQRIRTRAAALIGGALVLGAGAGVIAAYQARPLAVVVAGGRLRVSPHGRAPEVVAVEPGTAVRPTRRQGAWALVQAPGGRAGWLPVGALVTVSE
jgi:hypothetical protein